MWWFVWFVWFVWFARFSHLEKVVPRPGTLSRQEENNINPVPGFIFSVKIFENIEPVPPGYKKYKHPHWLIFL
jgi:hypothetical protein